MPPSPDLGPTQRRERSQEYLNVLVLRISVICLIPWLPPALAMLEGPRSLERQVHQWCLGAKGQVEDEPTPSRKSRGPNVWGGLSWDMCPMAAPHHGGHSWNRDLPDCPQMDPCLPPEAVGSPPFSGWQGPRTHSPQPAHLENGASGSNGLRGLRAAGLAAAETPLGGGRPGSKA